MTQALAEGEEGEGRGRACGRGAGRRERGGQLDWPVRRARASGERGGGAHVARAARSGQVSGPLSAPVVLLRVRSPLPSGVETLCPNCFLLCFRLRVVLVSLSSSVLSVYKLSGPLWAKTPGLSVCLVCARALSVSAVSHSSTPWIVALRFLLSMDFPG